MEESVSGFKRRGTWADVVEHGERITRALRDAGAEGTAFEEWDEWRPKADERLSEDVNEKTADQASVDEGAGERAGNAPNDDIQRAGEKLGESYAELENGDPEGVVERSKESIDYATRAADSAGRKALRRVEDAVYRRVMTRIAPYYFDNELVSAHLERGRDGTYTFEVNVNDDELKGAVSDRLAEYESVDRWHVDTEKDTTTAEAVEGVEPPDEADGVPRSTTN
jgi:hypothetical protein